MFEENLITVLIIALCVFFVFEINNNVDKKAEMMSSQKEFLLSDILFYQCTINQLNKNPEFDYFSSTCGDVDAQKKEFALPSDFKCTIHFRSLTGEYSGVVSDKIDCKAANKMADELNDEYIELHHWVVIDDYK